jgi:hypothetical protein
MTVQEVIVIYVVLFVMYAFAELAAWLVCRTWWVTKGPIQRLYLFRSRWGSLFLHKIVRPDADRDLHNHPWVWAKSLILRGGYKELRLSPTGRLLCKWVLAGQTNAIDDQTYHRIDIVLPGTITLFWHGARNKSWGFKTPKGHIDWKEYKNA